jgi:hypothetical protein
MTFRYKTGQSLSEYSLVIGLVALACIGGVALLSTQVQDRLGNTLGNTAPGGSSVVQIPKALAAPFTKQERFFLSPQEVQSILDQSPTETLDLGNGKKIIIPKPNFPELQETLGPNGSTEVALALIQRMQEALKAQGIDPEKVIPEMGFFASTAYNTSDIQKKMEMLLIKDPDKLDMDEKHLLSIKYPNDELSNGKLNSIFSNYQFTKDSQGDFTVANYMGTNPIKLKDFSTQEQMNLAALMTMQKLQADPALKNIVSSFSDIWHSIKTGSNSLTKSIEMRTSQTEGYIELPVWLNTKIEANKACILSKETHCIK